jgi:hypothetical protein
MIKEFDNKTPDGFRVVCSECHTVLSEEIEHARGCSYYEPLDDTLDAEFLSEAGE